MIYKLENEEDRESFLKTTENYLQYHETVELKKVYKKRTLNQNSFLHVLISLFGIEFGYSLEEAKTLLKRHCPFMRYQKKDEWFLRKTRDMDTEEIANFIDWIYVYSSKNGLNLPTSDEYKTNYIHYDSVISKNSEYL